MLVPMFITGPTIYFADPIGNHSETDNFPLHGSPGHVVLGHRRARPIGLGFAVPIHGHASLRRR